MTAPAKRTAPRMDLTSDEWRECIKSLEEAIRAGSEFQASMNEIQLLANMSQPDWAELLRRVHALWGEAA